MRLRSSAGTSRVGGLATPPVGAAVGAVVEQRLGRLPAHDRVGDRVGVGLVRVAGLADPAGELDPGPLLDHVRGLVGGGVQIR